jgi:hypothetical protein
MCTHVDLESIGRIQKHRTLSAGPITAVSHDALKSRAEDLVNQLFSLAASHHRHGDPYRRDSVARSATVGPQTSLSLPSCLALTSFITRPTTVSSLTFTRQHRLEESLWSSRCRLRNQMLSTKQGPLLLGLTSAAIVDTRKMLAAPLIARMAVLVFSAAGRLLDDIRLFVARIAWPRLQLL